MSRGSFSGGPFTLASLLVVTETRCWGLDIPLTCTPARFMYALLYNISLLVLSCPSVWLRYSLVLKLRSLREDPHRFSYGGRLVCSTLTSMTTVSTYMDESETFLYVSPRLLSSHSTGIDDQNVCIIDGSLSTSTLH